MGSSERPHRRVARAGDRAGTLGEDTRFGTDRRRRRPAPRGPSAAAERDPRPARRIDPRCRRTAGDPGRAGVPVGSTTGHTAEVMQIVVPRAAAAGVAPARVVPGDTVPAGRPRPWMILQALRELDAAPVRRAVKVDDAPVGNEAARQAGCRLPGGGAVRLRQRARPDRRPVGRRPRRRAGRDARPGPRHVPRRGGVPRDPHRGRPAGRPLRHRPPPETAPAEPPAPRRRRPVSDRGVLLRRGRPRRAGPGAARPAGRRVRRRRHLHRPARTGRLLAPFAPADGGDSLRFAGGQGRILLADRVADRAARWGDAPVDLVTGGGGGPLGTVGPVRPPFQNTVRRGHHFRVARVNGRTLESTAHDAGGRPFDRPS